MRRGLVAKAGSIALAWVLFLPALAFAQQAGTIAGVVTDTTSGVMPGVTVEASSPVLIEKVRTVVTNDQGRYTIVDLRPGLYTVTFTLAGFNTVSREGIELSSGFTAQVNAEMRVGELAETITVSGQSPLVDTQSVTQRRALTSATIDALPTGRRFVNLAILVPGVSVPLTNTDVGGSNNDRYQTMSVHGSRADQMPLVINGMPFNNMNATGGGTNTTMMINIGTVEEMTITTSGLSAEARTSGVWTNTIAKEGGNSFTAYLFGNYTNEHFNANNLTQDLKNRGLLAAPKAKLFWDFNPAVGGPIKRNKLWFYFGFRSWATRSYAAGTYTNKNPLAPQYCAKTEGCLYAGVLVPDSRDLNSQAITGDTWNRAETLNLTSQISEKNKVTFFAHFNQRLVDCNGCSATRSPEATTYFTHRPMYLLQATWSSPLTNKILLEGGGTFYNETWRFDAQPAFQNGYGPNAVIPKIETSTNTQYGSTTAATTANNHQYNVRFAVNYVTGSHAFKVGMQDMWGTRNYISDTNQAQIWRLTNGVPSSITQRAAPLDDLERLKAALGVYAQDRWTIRNVTLNLGVRFDYHNAYVPARTLPAIPFVAARQYNEIRDVPNWKDITPRIGVAWDLFGSGRTVVRGNYGKYLAGESLATATINNPVNTVVNSATRRWTDSNGNFVPDCDLRNPAANLECGALSEPLGTPITTTHFDPAILRGWGVRPSDQEIAVGIQHALIPSVAVDVQYTNHWFGNFFATQNRAQPASHYDEYCITAPRDVRLPDGGGYQVCGFYELKPQFFGIASDNLVTKASNFGDVMDRYQGVDVVVTARLARGGQLTGGVSAGHEVTDVCDLINQATSGTSAITGAANIAAAVNTLPGAASYPSTRWCRTSPPFTPTFKVNGSYPLPWWGLTTSVALTSRQGPNVIADWAVRSTETTLGRPFNAGSTATAGLIQPGTVYADRVNQLDLRFGKMFRLNRARIQASIDLYNALNSSAILDYNTTYSVTNNAWLQPTLIMPGRLLKFGGQLTF